jgi:hypothetical protein
MRRQFFNNEEAGYFKTQKRAAVNQNPMTDPSMVTDMLKGNVTNVLPMIVIGGWINWMFSGFVTSELCCYGASCMDLHIHFPIHLHGFALSPIIYCTVGLELLRDK